MSLRQWSSAQNYQVRHGRAAFSEEAYRKWRAALPFTDEQFAEVFERDAEAVEGKDEWLARNYRYRAERCRHGFVGRRDVTHCLDAMIKTCSICGKKALYRQGNGGRCSNHRLIKDKHQLMRIARLEHKFDEREKAAKLRDYRDAETKSLKTTGRSTKQAYK